MFNVQCSMFALSLSNGSKFKVFSLRFFSQFSTLNSLFHCQLSIVHCQLSIDSEMKQVIFPERIQSGGQHIEQSQRNHHSPAEMHQLIITETRDCPAYPHEEEYKEEYLSKED